MKSEVPEVSIIIRTKNEERWIAHCLKMVFDQDYDSFEVILVDNNSTDHTVEVAKRFPIAKIIKITQYKPGKALNDGIRASNGRYIVCLSAHCIPKNTKWINNLVSNFDNNDKLAGVYGRQLPVSFTEPDDKRDLLIVFGQERKVQKKDYFFHNANSMLPREVWNRFPFDEDVTNIEDRVWGKEVMEAGFHIIYDPSASVYHYHGLHQHGKPSKRAKGIAAILNKLDEDITGDLPESLKPENANIVAILPVLGKQKLVEGVNLLQRSLSYLKSEKYIDNIYVISDEESVENIAINNGVGLIKRPEDLKDPNLPVETILKYALNRIEELNIFPEAIMFINYEYPFRPAGLIDTLILDLQYKGLETVFPSYVDFGNYWQEIDNDDYVQVGDSLKPREKKRPFHRALYGVGCVTITSIIRTGKLIGDKVGIYPLNNLLFALRVDKETPIEIISSGIEYTKRKEKNVSKY